MSQPDDLVPLIPKLTRRARHLCRTAGDAEDLLQETLLSLCQRLRDGNDVDDLCAYAMRSLTNKARRHWKRPQSEELEDDMAVSSPVALLRLECRDTLAAVSALPEPQRKLMLHVINGETSPARIAEHTGLPLGTVMSRLARARAKLRLVLKSDL